jgi:hypothetical protein
LRTKWPNSSASVLITHKKVSACRIKNSNSKQIVTPDGWNYEKSLNKNYKFIRNEEIYEKVVFSRHEGESDVYLDIETGKEVFIGRSSKNETE